MSWLRSAINKAAEVGGKNIGPNLTRTVKSVAQQAGQAVAGGAKLVQERLAGRNLNSFKNAVRRLDDVALNSHGAERKQALERWLGALKEIGRDIKLLLPTEESNNVKSEDSAAFGPPDEAPSPRRATMVLFYDLEGDGEPLNFRDVFLRSHAIENIVTSMILEAPADEEVAMLLEIFGLCLAGGKELHNAIISSIQDLAKAFARYTEEVMIKKEDLLQFARDAINGLKLDAELERIDAQIAILKEQIAEKQGTALLKEDVTSLQLPVGVAQGASGEVSLLMNEGSRKTEEALQLGVKLRDLLQKKKVFLHKGDSQEARSEKVELLISLTGSLNRSAVESEKLITDNRNQKEAAFKYRVAKAQEVTEVEKAVAAEVKTLASKRDQLEAELKEVKAALAAATSRHINTQEEKEQFDEANTKIFAHLAIQEEELTRSVAANKAEAGVVDTWRSFLEDTWKLQSSCTEQKEKDVQDALDWAKQQFLQAVIVNLSYRQEELDLLLKQLKFCTEEMKDISNKRAHMQELGMDAMISDLAKGKRKMQEKYLEAEEQVVSNLRAVELMKEDVQSYNAITSGTGDLERNIMVAFEAVDQIRKELEALQRPDLQFESLTPRAVQASPKNKTSVKWADSLATGGATSHPFMPQEDSPSAQNELVNEKEKTEERAPIRSATNEESMELELEDPKDLEDTSHEETAGWEFDELEEELNREAVGSAS